MSAFNTKFVIQKHDGNIDEQDTIWTEEDLYKQVGDYRYRRISDSKVVFYVNRDKPLEFYVPDCVTIKATTGKFHFKCSCCKGAAH